MSPRRFQAWFLPAPLTYVGGVEVFERGHELEIEVPLLSEDSARSLVAHLRRARTALLERPAREIARALGAAGARLLDPQDELRREALEVLPASARLSGPMARAVLDGMAADWSATRLLALLDAELHGGAALDGFLSDATGRRKRALAPALNVHVCAGTVPGVSVTSLVRALLTKSAVLLKPGSGDEVLPVLFCRALAGIDPLVAAAVAVVYWKGGSDEPLERTSLPEADLLVVYGGDEAVTRARAAARATTPVVAYPHRLGIAVMGTAAMDSTTPGTRSASGPAERGSALERSATAAARAVALFDQRGCVSPHVFFVLGDENQAAAFAARLAEALRVIEGQLPAAPLEEGEASTLQQLRGTAEMESAVGGGRVWSGGAASWTVLLGARIELVTWPGRVARVVPVGSVEAVLQALGRFRRHLQTVAVAGLAPATLELLSEGLARLGAARIAPLESAPWPPPWWHHDGLGPLSALVRWTDSEEGGR